MPRILTVDPGQQTGYAFWPRIRSAPEDAIVEPTSFGEVSFDIGETWEEKAKILYWRFKVAVSELAPEEVFVEDQSLWAGSVRSYTAGVRGDLFKLSHIAGMLLACGLEMRANIHLVAPSSWKGQLPHNVVVKRVQEKLNLYSVRSEHIIDALGIGLYLQGAMGGFQHIWKFKR